MPLPLRDLAGLPSERLARLASAVEGHTTLAEVVRWGIGQSPPAMVSAVVKQDEFTQDIVLPACDNLYFVYDTT